MNDLIIFKRWFEGFCDAIDTPTPTVEQWQTLQQRIRTMNEAIMPSSPKILYSGDSPTEMTKAWRQHLAGTGDMADPLVPRHTDGDGL